MDFIINNIIIPITKNPSFFIIAGIIVYILAIIFSRFTNCRIVAGVPDFIILSILDLVIIAYIFLQDYDIDSIFSFIFFSLLAITVFFSIKSNWGILLPLYLILSLVAKIILLILIPISIFLLLVAAFSGEPDKRYKDGTKNNQQTRNFSLMEKLTDFFVFSLKK